MAQGPKPKDPPPLRIAIPANLHAYLKFLARYTPLGKKETDVAAYLLTQRLEWMLAEKYHEKLYQPEAPPPPPDKP
jgi:hypothetical protein